MYLRARDLQGEYLGARHVNAIVKISEFMLHHLLVCDTGRDTLNGLYIFGGLGRFFVLAE